ncbi:hypothetical protein PR048_012038 [Dryococelus australis]|uniref:Endonuclease/exonuclease/phosphatase domain-containing protein n=1 Tax=Dryococelus australis TaxID=614101 RepID=A0ABQ9HPH8_9NEOP|nr:hypothetical protein PR048_012038 [Dryococelus australis]
MDMLAHFRPYMELTRLEMCEGRRRPPTIDLVYWNVNGVCTQMYELEQLIKTYGLGILLINEIGLKPQHRLHIFSYESYRNDRILALKGGTAIIVKITLQHHRITLPSLDHIEIIAISVRTGGTNIVFIAAYKPPPNLITNEDPDKLTEHQSYLFLAAPTESTFYTNRYIVEPGIQNIILHDIPIDITPTVLTELDSDHLPVISELKLHRNNYTTSPRRGILVNDWREYKTILTEILPYPKPIKTTADIDAT